MTKPRKIATTVMLSDTLMAYTSGFPQKGHRESVEPTEADRAQHDRAAAAVKEINENRYISITGYDYDIELLPLETERWVADETDEEYVARWVNAGRPRPLDDALQEAVHEGLRKAFERD